MEKTGVSREDAENALRACSEDILDAILYLEALGKVERPSAASFTSANASDYTNRSFSGAAESASRTTANAEGKSTFSREMGRLFGAVGRLIKKGMENYLDVTKDGSCNCSIPLTILVFLFIPFFWLMTVLLLVLLLCGYRYEFRGPNFKSDDKANRVLNNASNAANAAKAEFKKGFEDGNTDKN